MDFVYSEKASIHGNIIGLTGNPGAGKSTVAKWFQEHGAYILSGDELGYTMLKKNSPAFELLIEHFGTAILDQEGNIGRKQLGDIVFNEPAQLRKLNSIVHPLMLNELKQKIDNFRLKPYARSFVLDAALIYEWKIETWFDIIILVAAPLELRRERFVAMRGGAHRFDQREKAQIPQQDKEQWADFIIRNDRDLNHLKMQFDNLFEF